MIGTGAWCTTSAKAAVSAAAGSVTRTSSQPAAASAWTWASVAAASPVARVGHRLHDDRRAAADRHAADDDAAGAAHEAPAWSECHRHVAARPSPMATAGSQPISSATRRRSAHDRLISPSRAAA